MSEKASGHFTLFGVAAVLCFALDIGSKYWVFHAVDQVGAQTQRHEIVVIPDWLSFISTYNKGAMWSLGHQGGDSTNTLLAMFAGTAALGIALWARWVLPSGGRGLALILGAILGGALGNFYDRVVFHGVRDFIFVHYRTDWVYPTFNLADSFLVTGAILLLIGSIFAPVEQPEQSGKEAAPSAASS